MKFHSRNGMVPEKKSPGMKPNEMRIEWELNPANEMKSKLIKNFRFNSAFIQTNETKFKAEFELSWIWFDAEIKLTGNLLL